MTRDHILALWTLGRLPSEDLPKLACAWLADGLDSRTLRELGGVCAPTMSEVGPLFDLALRELGIDPPKKEDALWFLARYHAKRIVDGVVTPYEGARKIWWEVSNSFEPSHQLLLSFVGAASELEDLPGRTAQDGHDRKKYARELEEGIIEAAQEVPTKEPNQTSQPTRSARG
jgi:hypothetical protein